MLRLDSHDGRCNLGIIFKLPGSEGNGRWVSRRLRSHEREFLHGREVCADEGILKRLQDLQKWSERIEGSGRKVKRLHRILRGGGYGAARRPGKQAAKEISV